MSTTEYAIEREILIDAPIEVVWRTVTEPEQMTTWFADTVELEIAPGAHGHMGFGDQGGPVVVETVEPPTCFSFRWNNTPSDEAPAPGSSILVEFTLVAEGDGTRLRVSETGLEPLPWSDVEKQRYADEHRHGWGAFLDRLAAAVPRST